MFIPLAMLFCASYEADDDDEDEYQDQFTVPDTWVDTCFANIDKPLLLICAVIEFYLIYKMIKSKWLHVWKTSKLIFVRFCIKL